MLCFADCAFGGQPLDDTAGALHLDNALVAGRRERRANRRGNRRGSGMGSIPASPDSDARNVPLLLCQERFNEASLSVLRGMDNDGFTTVTKRTLICTFRGRAVTESMVRPWMCAAVAGVTKGVGKFSVHLIAGKVEWGRAEMVLALAGQMARTAPWLLDSASKRWQNRSLWRSSPWSGT
jgi:hypothetical protein